MTDFVFLYPFWLLALLPLGLVLFLFARGRHSSGLIASHIADRLGIQTSTGKTTAAAFIGSAWLLSVIALAGPSLQKSEVPVYSTSGARVLVLDMSRSVYAQDVKPDRLTQIKYKALDMLPEWQEGTTGLIAYAGDAYTISPLTSDAATLANLIRNLSPEVMPYPGANAGAAVRLATDTLRQAGHQRGDIILIADDIDKQEKENIAPLLESSPWRLSILAVGTEDGAPIQLPDGKLLSNASGTPVVARTNMQTMQSLAQQSGGIFAPLQNDNSDVESITAFSRNSGADAARHQGRQISERVNNGFWLLPLLLLAALCLFRRGLIFICVLALTYTVTAVDGEASPWQTDNQAAYEAYQDREYQQAAEQFTDPKWQGIAAYKAGDYPAAIDALQGLDDAESRYNLANAYAQNGNLKQAEKLYENILAEHPDFSDARANLDIVKKAQQQQQNQNRDGSGSQQQQKNSSGSAQSGASSPGNPRQDSDPHSAPRDASQPQPDTSSSGSPSANRQASQPAPPSAADPAQRQRHQAAKQQAEQTADKQAGTQKKPMSQQDKKPATARGTTNSQPVDPEFRQLEQVENARDPSRLIKAQILLQARDKEAPARQDKSW